MPPLSALTVEIKDLRWKRHNRWLEVRATIGREEWRKRIHTKRGPMSKKLCPPSKP